MMHCIHFCITSLHFRVGWQAQQGPHCAWMWQLLRWAHIVHACAGQAASWCIAHSAASHPCIPVWLWLVGMPICMHLLHAFCGGCRLQRMATHAGHDAWHASMTYHHGLMHACYLCMLWACICMAAMLVSHGMHCSGTYQQLGVVVGGQHAHVHAFPCQLAAAGGSWGAAAGCWLHGMVDATHHALHTLLHHIPAWVCVGLVGWHAHLHAFCAPTAA